MIRLFQWLVFGHCHKWKIIKVSECTGSGRTTGGRWTRHYVQCESCGKVRVFDA